MIAWLAIVTIVVFGWLLIFVVCRGRIDIICICAVGFVLRSILALLNAYVVELPGSGRDDEGFHEVACQVAALEWSHVWYYSGTGKKLYEVFIASIYKVFGPNPLIPITLNVVCGTLSVVFVWLLSLEIWKNQKTAIMAAACAALFPTLAIYSALLMRDSMFICFVMAGLACLVISLRKRSLLLYGGAVGLWLCALALHSAAIGLLPILTIGFVFSDTPEGGGLTARDKRELLVLGVVSVIILLLPLTTGWGMSKFTRYRDMEFAEAVAEQQTKKDVRNRASYLTNLQPSTAFDVLWQAPIRLVYFLLTPFPWMVRSATDVFGLLVALLTAMTLITLLRAKAAVCKNRSAVLVVLLALSLSAVFAVGVTNYGTAIRHRTKVIPIFLVAIPFFLVGRSLDQRHR